MNLPALLLGLLVLAGPGAAGAEAAPTPAPARAESIRGQVVEQNTARPVEGAMVVLADAASGTRRGATLTGTDGRFSLTVPGPGRYRLRVERVGYVTTASDAIDVGAGAVVEHRMSVPVQAVMLEGLNLSARRRRCNVRSADGEPTEVIWEEARKALASAALAQDQGLFTFHVRRFERELDASTLRVNREDTTLSVIPGARPFQSIPAARLAAQGYVQKDGSGMVFYAPDASVLVSDEFVEGHCFTAVRGRGEREGLVGLVFEPTGERRIADVRGTLWLDRRSAELKEMEYRYTGLEGEADSDEVGGSQRFERLPGGAWIVREWKIRMPVIQEQRIAVTGREESYQSLLALKEEGGEVVRIDTRGAVLRQGTLASALEGTVFDSTRSVPLAGARVFLSGTSHEATTDAEGRFRMAGVSPGRYALSFTHPRLDTLEYVAAPRDAEVRAAGGTPLALAVPPLSSIRRSACRDVRGGVLFGLVADGSTGQPLPSARVSATWAARDAEDRGRATATTDPGGNYVLCGLPTDREAVVTAEQGARRSASEKLAAAAEPRQHRFTVVAPQAQLAVRAQGQGGAAAAAANAPVRVSGRVLADENGRALPGTLVRLVREGADPILSRTDDRGRFAYASVAPGQYRLEVEHPSLRAGAQALAVEGGAALEVELRMPASTVALEPLRVVSGRVERGTVRGGAPPRRRMAREEIERRRNSSRTVGDLIASMPGVRVRDLYYPNTKMVKEQCIELSSTRPSLSVVETTDALGGSVVADAEPCRQVSVYVDDALIQMEAGTYLRSLSLDDIESVEVMTTAEAGGRFGYTANGVIVVYTRGNGPEVNAPPPGTR